MPEEDISFRRSLHELWKSREEEKTGAILTGSAPWRRLPHCCGAFLAWGPFPWVGGQGLPLAGPRCSRHGVLEEPLVQIHPSLAWFAFQQRRLVHAV